MSAAIQVLIVDDDPIQQLVTRKLIAHCSTDIRVQSAENGREGLEVFLAASSNPNIRVPDFVFLDIEMPEMNGWEFLKAFSSLPKAITKRVTVYVASSSINPEDKGLIHDYPIAAGLLEKPIPLETLKRILGVEAGEDSQMGEDIR